MEVVAETDDEEADFCSTIDAVAFLVDGPENRRFLKDEARTEKLYRSWCREILRE